VKISGHKGGKEDPVRWKDVRGKTKSCERGVENKKRFSWNQKIVFKMKAPATKGGNRSLV